MLNYKCHRFSELILNASCAKAGIDLSKYNKVLQLRVFPPGSYYTVWIQSMNQNKAAADSFYSYQLSALLK